MRVFFLALLSCGIALGESAIDRPISAALADSKPPANPSGASLLTGLPLHGSAATLAGKLRPIKTEQCTWIYPFSWSGLGADGRIVQLAARQPVELASYDKPSRVFGFRLPNGQLISVKHPPNTFFHNLLAFRTVPVIGITQQVLINRLGEPADRVRQGDTEIWEYRRTQTETRTGADQSYSTTTGSLDGNPYSSETTTSAPYTEARTVSPYDFKVTINKDGRVSAIQDACPPPSPWRRL